MACHGAARCGTALLALTPLSQDHVFKLDARRAEDGKGKSPYDPRHAAASVLVGRRAARALPGLWQGLVERLPVTLPLVSARRGALLGGGHRSDGARLHHLPQHGLPPVRPHGAARLPLAQWSVPEGGVSAPGGSLRASAGSGCATHPLPEPKFVDVFWVPESKNPDDDKIYFFFRETAVERQQGLGKASVSRIGQICRVGAGSRSGAVGPWGHPSVAAPRPTERRGRAAQPGEQVDDVPQGAPGVCRARHRRRRHAL